MIRVPADKLFPLSFGDSSIVLVGQKILALGNPFGLERTLTSGIVSSLERSLKAAYDKAVVGDTLVTADAASEDIAFPDRRSGPRKSSP